MFPRKALPVLLAMVILLTGLSARPVLLQSNQDGEFFEETRHWVKSPFLDFYRQAPDPLLLFGYPITDELDHPFKQGVKIQYFQRARMEWDANASAGVTLTPLGEILYDGLEHGEKADFPITNGACRAFSETGKPVCYAFLQFYDANQGARYFGNPISDVEILNNRLVQYFQYARMEWRPDREPGQRVVLTDVGRLDFDIFIGDPRVLNSTNNAPEPVPSRIQVFVFPDRPLIQSPSRQKVFVIVYDQNQLPVKNAQVIVEVHHPDGTVGQYRPEAGTNADGFLEVSFDVKGLQPNQVVRVIAKANRENGPQSVAETQFRIWW